MEDFLNVNEIEITVECLEEDMSPHDTFDDCMTKEEINDLWKRSENNPWLWCCIKVTASYETPSGKVFEESDYLGGCSYDSRKDFIENSGYYEGMRDEVIQGLCRQLQGYR